MLTNFFATDQFNLNVRPLFLLVGLQDSSKKRKGRRPKIKIKIKIMKKDRVGGRKKNKNKN